MDQEQILARITAMVDDERRLRDAVASGQIDSSTEHERLGQLERELDQCWVVSVQALGSLLVVAVLVALAACARVLTHRLTTMLWVSIAVAIAGGAAGLYASYYAGTAGGASIALCLVGAYLAALCADALRGVRA